jgi:hypothetical protein
MVAVAMLHQVLQGVDHGLELLDLPRERVDVPAGVAP